MLIDNHDLGLAEFRVVDKKDNGSDWLYVLEPISRPLKCPDCNCSKIHIHKKVCLHVKDLPAYEHRVGLLIQGHSFRCSECGALIHPAYSGINGRLTERLKERIKEESVNHPFSEVGRRYGVSDTVVGQLFNERMISYKENYELTAPEVLGIDEVHLDKHYYGVFVKIDKNEGEVIEMSRTRAMPAVAAVLRSMKHPENLKYVTIDMWEPYAKAMKAVFPKIPIVIDRFHVIKELNKCLDAIRSKVSNEIKERKTRTSLKHNRFLILKASENLNTVQQKRLEAIFEANPEFVTPYLLKEAFRNIYSLARSREEAERMYDEWCKDCEPVPQYQSFIKTVNNWKTEIFNFFDVPNRNRTNAQTESLNHIIKEVSGKGRGYSFDVLRCKMLFRHTVNEPEKFDFNAF